jgi:septum formation protein
MLTGPLFTTLAPLILASSSPRRQQMLQGLGLEFTVVTAEVDETALAGEVPAAFADRLARAKARAVAADHPDAWVLGADTVVTVDGLILGKPRDPDEAFTMLRRLSGRRHQVLSAFCLCSFARKVEAGEVDTTGVTFITASEKLLAAYVASGEPMDKAGAYGIQGLGAVLVRGIEGSCATVIGLPLDRVIALLLQYRVIAPRRDGRAAMTNA